MSLGTRERKRGYCSLSGKNNEDPTGTVMTEIGQRGTDSKEHLGVKILSDHVA